MISKWLRRSGRANASVEFALITSLFVVPLLLGASDFVSIIAAQAQLNTALEALYYYGVTNPGGAISNTSSIITAINANSDFQMSVASQSLSYVCYTTQTSASTAPSFGTSSSSNNCSSGQTTMTYANYKLTTNVTLPVKLPGLSNPLPLSASGSIQVATKNN